MSFRLFQQKIREEIEKSNNPSLYDEFWLWLFEVTGEKRAFYISNMDEPFPDQSIDQIFEMMQRRITGEPLAYIVGKTSFYGRDFKIRKNILVPRSDSEIMIEILLSFLGFDRDGLWNISKSSEFLQSSSAEDHFSGGAGNTFFFYDFCSGSGCLGITVFLELQKRNVIAEGILTDLSQEAVTLARENCIQFNIHHQLSCVQADLTAGQSRLADFILSNPPYIPESDIDFLMKEVSCFEPRLALDGGSDGLLFYNRLAEEAMPLLKKNGVLLVEHGHDQAKSVANVFNSRGYTHTQCFKDYGGNDRITLIWNKF